MAEDNQKWYVIRAISGKENKVKETIENSLKNGSDLALYVSQVLVPTEKVYVNRAGGKRVLKERNFLPGYVLIHCNLTDECYPMLRNIPNVLGFLGEGKSTIPAPVREAEINRIMGKVDEQVENVEVENPFVVGDLVRVTTGPFSGFDGSVEEVQDKKLKVLVTVFGRNTPLELDCTQVEKQS